MRNETDGALLRCAADDPAAFDELYRRHEPVVVAYLQRRTRDAERTADLVAETFVTALRNGRRFRDDGQPALGWLLGIARHAFLHDLEHRGAEQRALQRIGMASSAISDDSIERIEAVIDLEAAGNPFIAALERLPLDQREALRAHVLDERPYGEIAAELGVPAATVRQRVSRGLSRLRTLATGDSSL